MLTLTVATVGRAASGLTSNTHYKRMVPLSQYLMADRQAEIALARSAAPQAIAFHATILVLGRHGYEIAKKGSNGFTCLVERSWLSPFDSVEFWNWKMRGPICYNPPASRSVLLYTLKRTNLVLSGLTKSQLLDRIKAAVADKRLAPPEAGSMSYMMSRHQYLGDAVAAWISHIMIYAPKSGSAKNGASWGADLRGSPVIFDNSHTVVPEPETIFMIPVAHWSDGTPVPM